MDYTTKEQVKAELGSTVVSLDTLLTGTLIPAASRAIDRFCTRTSEPDAENYFLLETRADEILNGQVDNHGNVLVYPHKPLVTAVAAFAYRTRPFDDWIVVGPSRVWFKGLQVEAFPTPVLHLSTGCQVKITYTGGLADQTANLPADLRDAATLLTIRFLREAESGLSDAIGIAELATLQYTKAWPVRVVEMLQPYVRTVGWRFVA